MTRLHQSREPNRYRKRGMFFEVYMGVNSHSHGTTHGTSGTQNLHIFHLISNHENNEIHIVLISTKFHHKKTKVTGRLVEGLWDNLTRTSIQRASVRLKKYMVLLYCTSLDTIHLRCLWIQSLSIRHRFLTRPFWQNLYFVALTQRRNS